MNSLARERLYYEIAMSIGNSLDIRVMLKESLPTYLRKLNCLAGAVLRRVPDGNGFSFELVHAIPRRMKCNSAVQSVIADIPTRLENDALKTYIRGLPVIGSVSGYGYYVMDLPEYGLLVLVKSAPGLSRPNLKSLALLNLKLAEACRSCDANDRLQREIRERLRAEKNYKAIFDNAVEGLFQSTLGGRFLTANPSMARIVGYDSPENLIESVSDLDTQLYVDQTARERYMQKLMKYGKVTGFEAEFYRKDGSTGWMSVSSRLVLDDEGNPQHIEGITEDVTSRKQALIALREAKREAEQLSQMKSNFLSMVSHELRTPLTSILGFSKITRKRLREILDEDTPCQDDISGTLERIRENTGIIIAEGERLTELITNVLDLAKLEAGYFEWKEGAVSMVDVLKHSLSACEILFEEAGVELRRDVPDSLPHVNGDRDRLVQVVINLVSNAVKFTGEGGVDVSAVVEDDFVVVRVRDTGIGVPPDKVDVIFDKFRQLGDTLTDKPKGTGLGLPICKEIVEHHGGRIWLEPAEPTGSVFVFSIPVS